MSDETVTSYLSTDHRRLDAILDGVVAHALADDRGETAARFRRFRAGLERHIELEESILFPLFEERSGITTGPTRVMRFEHQEIREVLAVIDARLQKGTLTDLLADVARLAELLGRHNLKEERILYPTSDRLAGADLPDLMRRLIGYDSAPAPPLR
jgi:hemerythrin-like domain-containing protein